MRTKPKRNRSILLRLLVLGVSVYMVITLAGLWGTLRDSRSEFAELQSHADTLSNDVEQRKELLADGSQAELIQRELRRAGYVYPDELIYKAYQ